MFYQNSITFTSGISLLLIVSNVNLNGSEIDPTVIRTNLNPNNPNILFEDNFRKSPRVLMMGSTR